VPKPSTKIRRPHRRLWSRWIKRAADERAVGEGCWFDQSAGERVVEFFGKFLRHTLGQWAGQPFQLLDWQRDDVVMPLFGWMRADGRRRFRRAYIEVRKKNGKSTLCGGLALYLLLADGEPRAQIYGAAADRDQAGIVFNEAANMVQASGELARRLEVVRSTKRIIDARTGSLYHAISADAYSNEGLNAHGIIFDELHAQKNRDLWDALRYSTASRRQPLLIAITTAGYDRESICYEQHDYAQGVLDGVIDDASLFACIRAARPDDDWTDPEVWRRANPSFGVTIDADQFADDFQEARQSPRKESAFRRYRLNQWLHHADCWLSSEVWQRGAEPFDPAMLEGQQCSVGIDLARKRDIAAVVLVFPIDGSYYLLPRFYLPREGLADKEREDHVSYAAWARAGLLTLTDGDVIDYRVIRNQIGEDAQRYTIHEIAYDPWNAELLCNQQLGQEDGFEVVEVRQTMAMMAPATAELEKLLQAGRLRHGGHPVLTWMAGHTAVRQDVNQNIMPSKKNSTSRIDGIVATIIGLSRAVFHAPKRSVYETRGLLEFYGW
jgi:phage terminase large subunit-like protein